MNTTRLSQGWPGVSKKESHLVNTKYFIDKGDVFLDAASLIEGLEGISDGDNFDIPLRSLIDYLKSVQIEALTRSARER